MKKTFIILLTISSILFFSCSKPGDLTIQRAIKAYQSQNTEEALNLFKTSLEEESNYSQELIYNFITNIYLQNEDFENAVIYQEKICESRPEYKDLVSLGMTYHLLSLDTKAEDVYQKAILVNPKKAEAYASLGSLYLSEKKIDLAIENLKKASELEPKIAMIHANLGIAYFANNEHEKSEAEFKTAEELKCENLDEYRSRAESFGEKL